MHKKKIEFFISSPPCQKSSDTKEDYLIAENQDNDYMFIPVDSQGWIGPVDLQPGESLSINVKIGYRFKPSFEKRYNELMIWIISSIFKLILILTRKSKRIAKLMLKFTGMLKMILKKKYRIKEEKK